MLTQKLVPVCCAYNVYSDNSFAESMNYDENDSFPLQRASSKKCLTFHYATREINNLKKKFLATKHDPYILLQNEKCFTAISRIVFHTLNVESESNLEKPKRNRNKKLTFTLRSSSQQQSGRIYFRLKCLDSLPPKKRCLRFFCRNTKLLNQFQIRKMY